MGILITYIASVLVSMGVNAYTINKICRDIDKNNLMVNKSFYNKGQMDEILKSVNISNYQGSIVFVPLINIIMSINNSIIYNKNNKELIDKLASIDMLQERKQVENKKKASTIKSMIGLYRDLEYCGKIKLIDGEFYYYINFETYSPTLIKTTGIYQTLSNGMQEDIFEEIIDLISMHIIGDMESSNKFHQGNSQLMTEIEDGNIHIFKTLNDFRSKKEEQHFRAPMIDTNDKPKIRIKK